MSISSRNFKKIILTIYKMWYKMYMYVILQVKIYYFLNYDKELLT